MSIHKLTAGSGYDYLTRQVAALDATEKGHVGLASYYTERGETPGVWAGSGMAGIDGLSAGDVVTAEQMQALFGSGLHPLAAQRSAQLHGQGLGGAVSRAAMRLGVPFKVYENDFSPFRVEVAKRIAALNADAGLPGDWPVPADDRAAVRTQVARELFHAEHGREPVDARELAGAIARHSRSRTRAVAGYDLTFSPVKSVSALWAVAHPSVAASVERAHQAAVRDALTFLERYALFTRTGANGVRQVDVQGLIATAFTHRDSRAGDPDLHTHVAVANKVQTRDGRWLSIDGRVLFKATVAASETYNTALEQHLRDSLGVRFEERANPDPRLRPVREIVGVDAALNVRWSARRALIETRRGELAAKFQRDHGRPPTPVESLHLAQQATLETREAKHEPRTLAEQRTTWQAQASEVLGGPRAVKAMVHRALSPTRAPTPTVDARWVRHTAQQVLASMEEHRATWQVWHVRAEAHRRVRAVQVPTDRVEALVDLLVADVLRGRSVSLARPADGIDEPPLLRRADGSSVYTVAGAGLYTSPRVLDAEQRLVTAAGRTDGRTVEASAVAMALLESTANGVSLNAGQTALVRAMATSGARVQLAIAPAGAGKTTAMRALTTAWTEDGGTVIGLAPSAAAAAALRDHIATNPTQVVTDTLAKLTWSLQHGDPPAWVRGIGPSTLVVVDEAGMADTLSLDAVVSFVVGRGGSVRLVGDDQQLAAIGAGGVLRDIQATHGAVRLTELLRFTDPAEGAASLALRDGRTEALGFYLDHHRVHVGDLTTVTDDVFSAWQTDRDGGLDSIMLAPTRELAAELNQLARAHRLSNQPADTIPQDSGGTRTVLLADGSDAGVGDLVITRSNDRRLRTTTTDWVKNGDRWTILAVTGSGDLQVQHTQNRHLVRLPAAYVQTQTELGYAATVHTAQGITADSMHGLANGEESRQQLYTMLTRGRHSNHVYLHVVGDGDPHSVIRPETIRPSTPTDLLEQILARDEAPKSATTLQRDQHDPAHRLGDATQRYIDALHAAAEDLAGPHAVEALTAAADRLVPTLSEEPAWPTLRSHLLLLAATGADPQQRLHAAIDSRELGSAGDRAAVLDWRLDDTSHNTIAGPLPWVPGIPDRLAASATWGPYLSARSDLVASLAATLRATTRPEQPPVDRQHNHNPPTPSIAQDVAVWRAAMQVAPQDRRPTGPPQLGKAAHTWQQHLNRALAGQAPSCQEWTALIQQTAPGTGTDPFVPVLAERLAAISRAGINAHQLLQAAAREGDLPDDHPAAALWWRISPHLTPPVDADNDNQQHLTTPWTPLLAQLVGDEQAAALQASRWWPPLVTAIDHALQQGWRLDDLVTPPCPPADAHTDDTCQRLVWRTSILSDPEPAHDLHEPPFDPAPDDMWDGTPWTHPQGPGPAQRHQELNQPAGNVTSRPVTEGDDRWVEADLAVAAMIRDLAPPPEHTDADVHIMLARATAWHESPVTRERMLDVNQLTWRYFRNHFPHSWGRGYLHHRFGHDLNGHPQLQPGQAPAGWTGLVNHLRRHGVTDEEMTATGVATTASTGRLIDRFRDRVIFPIVHEGDILGFVGRRHPNVSDGEGGGPKYLNTPDTPLFHKGAQLFNPTPQHLRDGGTPVIVEGFMDAIAVTIATNGRYVGVAPLGTALTTEQAAQLARFGVNPVIATDADLAGRAAAERGFWLLTPYGLDPKYAHLPEGTDPASLLTSQGAPALAATLDTAAPLGDRLLDEALANEPPDRARAAAARITAARPSFKWALGTALVRAQLQLPLGLVRKDLCALVNEWNVDPRAAARKWSQNVDQRRPRPEAPNGQTQAGTGRAQPPNPTNNSQPKQGTSTSEQSAERPASPRHPRERGTPNDRAATGTRAPSRS